jgi:prepilin signal peptidase PulO-like enzyme (type II secretory pathway)
MKKQVVRISVLQSSKIVTALYVIFGFLYTLIGILMLIFGGEGSRLIAIIYILMPVILAILGFIFFVIFSALYNFLAKYLGGIEVQIKNFR